jgi:hypothetical protein
MKQKRKHLLKKFLIFGIAVLLASCSEELYDEAIDSSKKERLKKLDLTSCTKTLNLKICLKK